ncbi:polyprenyl diphosphate synthase [Amycolatopsis sp. H20-H5]|uniref:polyprenyl diphosphate synthase n=1 Tax=Amycolatopsis sp. H20-H5 TaxID=3046309 RepID=UPI002DBC5064|nr:polyprenyl diphosphate synthase [Amycolatopsis sp. H20-H5]MEC3980140.1 polyprenyl diphosphate synthase [Amycolatopsis sp. H20-H5]
MGVKNLVLRAYQRRLRARVLRGAVPGHVAVIVDGNRRWARGMGFEDVRLGHKHGAEHILRLMSWCEDLGIGRVTVFLASVDNLSKRASPEMTYLMQVIEDLVTERLSGPSARWRVRPAGRLDLLPASTAAALKNAAEDTRGLSGPELTFAIGYGGREEVVDAVRSLLIDGAVAGRSMAEIAETVSTEEISGYLYIPDQPDPDLIIRTSGEQRLSGFLLWQSPKSELYFSDVYWPGFRYVDLLRAVRAYGGSRSRR